jgi:hypothetical protein
MAHPDITIDLAALHERKTKTAHSAGTGEKLGLARFFGLAHNSQEIPQTAASFFGGKSAEGAFRQRGILESGRSFFDGFYRPPYGFFKKCAQDLFFLFEIVAILEGVEEFILIADVTGFFHGTYYIIIINNLQ